LSITKIKEGGEGTYLALIVGWVAPFLALLWWVTLPASFSAFRDVEIEPCGSSTGSLLRPIFSPCPDIQSSFPSFSPLSTCGNVMRKLFNVELGLSSRELNWVGLIEVSKLSKHEASSISSRLGSLY